MSQINSNRTFVEIRDETAWGDEGAGGNAELVPVLDGEYSVGLEDPVREQQHVVGDQDAFYATQDRRNLGGSFKTGCWPHLSKRLLDWAVVRTSGETGSIAVRDDLPGIEARVHAGLKVDSLTIEGSTEGDIMFNFDCRGRHEETESNLTYPGSYTIPDIPSLTFKNTRYVISLNASGDDSFTNRISPVGLSSFSLSFRNNLKEGPPVEDRTDLEKDGRPEYLTAGRRNMEVRFTATFDRQAYMTLQRQRLYAQFKMLGAHPAWTNTAVVDAAGASAGTSVAVPVTADVTSNFSVNDYVLFDNAGGSNLPCVGKITAITATDMTIDTLDENVVSGDNIFNAAIEIRTAPILVSTTTLQRNFDDTLLVEVSGQIFSGGAEPLTYKATDMTLP